MNMHAKLHPLTTNNYINKLSNLYIEQRNYLMQVPWCMIISYNISIYPDQAALDLGLLCLRVLKRKRVKSMSATSKNIMRNLILN